MIACYCQISVFWSNCFSFTTLLSRLTSVPEFWNHFHDIDCLPWNTLISLFLRLSSLLLNSWEFAASSILPNDTVKSWQNSFQPLHAEIKCLVQKFTPIFLLCITLHSQLCDVTPSICISVIVWSLDWIKLIGFVFHSFLYKNCLHWLYIHEISLFLSM